MTPAIATVCSLQILLQVIKNTHMRGRSAAMLCVHEEFLSIESSTMPPLAPAESLDLLSC